MKARMQDLKDAEEKPKEEQEEPGYKSPTPSSITPSMQGF